MLRTVTATAALLCCTAIAAPIAHAGITDEINAADEVERVLEKRDKHLSYLADCRQTGRTTFTCSWFGTSKGGDMANGRASVRKLSRYKYRARITSFRRS